MNEDRSSRYHRLRRQASLAVISLEGLFLVALLLSGGSMWLRDLATQWSASRAQAVALYCALLWAAAEALRLPGQYYRGVVLDRRYGLLTQPPRKWLFDHLKEGLIGLLFGVAAGLVVVAFLSISPDHWWLLTAAVFSAALVGLARLAPVLLLPLFYTLKPIGRETLVSRLVDLAQRADTSIAGVFEWRVSDHTRKANAVLAGLGRTRRILLSDTLLAEHSDDEVAVVIAHELAHHVHRDLWATLALEAAVLTFGLYVADGVLTALVSPLGLAGKADVAGLPLVLLGVGAASIAARPVVNAVSRFHERRADQYALDLTGDPAAFVTVMRRLSARNLAEEQPSRLVEWLVCTHPPMARRIAAARIWAARTSKTVPI